MVVAGPVVGSFPARMKVWLLRMPFVMLLSAAGIVECFVCLAWSFGVCIAFSWLI
jgi:hypothetical protein